MLKHEMSERLLALMITCVLRDRGEPVPGELSMEVAQQIKEAHCYTCGDIVKVQCPHVHTTPQPSLMAPSQES